jgi:hemerythrin superfamily protein
MTETAPEPIEAVLRSDHQAILRDLDQLRVGGDEAELGRLFGQVGADIVRHFVAEEQYLFPVAREHLPNGRDAVEAAFAEHRQIEQLLRKFDEEHIREERISGLFDELYDAMQAHKLRQEHHIIPQLVAALDERELADLGEKALGAEQLAPTHPRAFAPKSATVNKITSWLTGLVEKALDSRDAE